MEINKKLSNPFDVSNSSLKRCLLGGLLAGIVAAILANIGNLLLGSIMNLSYSQLNLLSITISSLITNLVGSIFYFGFTRLSKRPILYYSVLAFSIATIDSIFVAVNPPVPGFGTIANPLHYIVAISSAIIIPYVVKGRKNEN